MSIPANIIIELNKLEESHDGTVLAVPDNDPELKKLNQFFNPKIDRVGKENEIKQLIEDGYSRREIADKLSTSQDTVRKVIIKYNLEIKPLFSYVAIKKGYPKVYSRNYQYYSQMVSGTPWTLDKERKALAKKGYRLIKLHKPSHWKNLAPGDIYLERHSYNVKK